MTRNQDVARILYEISQLLEIQQVPFKPRAYQRAGLNIESLGEDIETVAKEDRLGEIPGVGKAIAEKVKEYLQTGTLVYLEKLRKELPEGVVSFMTVPGVGPRKALRLQEELGVNTISQLKRAALQGKIREIKGFGEKSEKEILEGIARVEATPKRLPYPTAYENALDILGILRKQKGVERAEYAGSLRRGRDTVGDVDLLVVASPDHVKGVVDAFKGMASLKTVLESGSTRVRVLLQSGLQVDLRIVAKESFGAAWQYFTGSKEHNIALRTLALKKGWTINEYALARKKDGRRIAGATEEEIYEKLGMAWIPPEIRENQGEIDQAAKASLPSLITLKDLRGDLHTHTNESDGYSPAEDMVAQAKRLGYEWYGISDHSKGLGVARGLDSERYAKQRKALAKLQSKNSGVKILQGGEINVRKDGRLDFERKELAQLDYVVGSVHGAFGLSEKEQTQRVVTAIGSGVDILGHPSGRLLGERPELQLDWDAVFDAAKQHGVALEINASPFRLDLNGERARAARERGILLAIDSDAHTISGLSAMAFGITQARRGSLEPRHVLTAQPLKSLEKHLGHAKKK